MSEVRNDYSKSKEEGDKKKEERFIGPCKYCPLSRIGCPMSRLCERIFQR